MLVHDMRNVLKARRALLRKNLPLRQLFVEMKGSALEDIAMIERKQDVSRLRTSMISN